MNDQPMDDKPRRNLATIARKVLNHVYEKALLFCSYLQCTLFLHTCMLTVL